LNDQSLDLLQDWDHCGLLHKNIHPQTHTPNLVFKQKTPDGGEQYLPWGLQTWSPSPMKKATKDHPPASASKPNAAQCGGVTAVLNHPAINRHTKSAAPVNPASEPQPARAVQAAAAPAIPRPRRQLRRGSRKPVAESQKPGPEPAEPGPVMPLPGPPPDLRPSRQLSSQSNCPSRYKPVAA